MAGRGSLLARAFCCLLLKLLALHAVADDLHACCEFLVSAESAPSTPRALSPYVKKFQIIDFRYKYFRLLLPAYKNWTTKLK